MTSYILKTIALTSLGGVLLGGLLAVAVSEFDGYYDGLLVRQSLGLGLLAGLVAGIGKAYYQPIRHELIPVISAHVTGYFNRQPVFPPKPELPGSGVVLPRKSGWSRFWGFLGRSSLGGLLGLLLGCFGGLWVCVESYGDLSSEAQGWVLFYLPFYAITLIACAALGILFGALVGVVWSLLR